MIARTRVETIGRCLPPESGKFCTRFCTQLLRQAGQPPQRSEILDTLSQIEVLVWFLMTDREFSPKQRAALAELVYEPILHVLIAARRRPFARQPGRAAA